MIKIEFAPPLVNTLAEGLRREWLETNGIGGWASSTIIGANTRRYHGLLVAATKPPVGRMVMLSKLDETVEVGDETIELGCSQYPGLVHPEGFKFLSRFSRGLFPEFEFSLNSNEIRIRKTIAALHGENSTVVIYELLRGPQSLHLQLCPFLAARDYHHLTKENPAINRQCQFSSGSLKVTPYEGVPDLHIKVPGSTFIENPVWYYNFEYAIELERGLDFREDLFSHGHFRVPLVVGKPLAVLISTRESNGRDTLKLFKAERDRRELLLADAPIREDLCESLTLAVDQFIVSRDNELKTLIAGYHWFTDWGRDTMIALPGACLVTKRFEDAKRILRAFTSSVSQGMIPNRFPDSGEAPEYNTVDATLWYFVAVWKYLEYSGDEAFVRSEVLPALCEIISWHEQGTRFNIHIDEDGLLSAGTPGQQLTWMDAKVGEWVVTPRHGQPVEVNALWYNALSITHQLLERFGMLEEARPLGHRCRRLKESFIAIFWNERLGCLFDYINGDYQDEAVRPNQLLALSLPFPLLAETEALQVIRIVRERLLTPVGLRTLDPQHAEYKGSYRGDQKARDAAYHQGSVWTWLLGPYITSLCRYEPNALPEIERILNHLTQHLADAGLGTISEIFDGNAPHEPRGCIAQAWSVAEILRSYLEDVVPLRNKRLSKSVPTKTGAAV